MEKRFAVTKKIEFDAGHRVPNHASHCRNVHGHRYTLAVTVSGPLVPEGNQKGDEGMVMDFAEVKAALMLIHGLCDHTFLAFEDDPLLDYLVIREHSHKETPFGHRYEATDFGVIQEMACVPTAENIAQLCYEQLKVNLERGDCRVEYVDVWETPSSVARYPYCAKVVEHHYREMMIGDVGLE